MRKIQNPEAETHKPQILDEVERGETTMVTRRGRPIHRVVPETDLRQQEINNTRRRRR